MPTSKRVLFKPTLVAKTSPLCSSRLSFQERIDRKTLRKLMKCPQLRSVCSDETDYQEQLSILKWISKIMKGNCVGINYSFPKHRKFGRVYPIGYPSQGRMWRQIRGTLIGDNYVDIDIENAHPTMMLQLAQQFKRSEELPATQLLHYVNHRQECLSNLMSGVPGLTRDNAKNIYIALLYGGNVDYCLRFHKAPAEFYHSPTYTHLREFSEQLSEFKEFINKQNPDIVAETREAHMEYREYEVYRSAFSVYLQDWERRVLEEVVAFCKEKGLLGENKRRYDACLMFDGLAINKQAVEKYGLERLLSELSSHISATIGFNLKFSAKPMEQFDLSGIELGDDESERFVGDKIPEDMEAYDEWKRRFEQTFFYSVAQTSIGRIRTTADDTPEKAGDIAWVRVDETALWKTKTFPMFLCGDVSLPAPEIWKDDREKLVRRVVYEPHPDRVRPTDYNLFPGIYASSLPSGVPADLKETALHHFLTLTHTLFGERTEFVLNWVAHMVQKPWEKPGTGLVLTGGQGSGKDTWVLFLKGIIGSTLYAYINNIEIGLFGAYATSIKRALLANVAEIEFKAMNRNASAMKSLMTENYLPFNQKFEPIVHLHNYTRFIFTSNKPSPMPIEQDERRYVICNVSNKLRGNHEFWKTCYAVLENDTGLQFRAIYDYLMARDISSFNPRVFKPLENEIILREMSIPSHQRFITDYSRENFTTPVMRVRSNELFELYRDYCSTHHLTSIPTSQAFWKVANPWWSNGFLINRKRTTNGANWSADLRLDAVRAEYDITSPIVPGCEIEDEDDVGGSTPDVAPTPDLSLSDREPTNSVVPRVGSITDIAEEFNTRFNLSPDMPVVPVSYAPIVQSWGFGST